MEWITDIQTYLAGIVALGLTAGTNLYVSEFPTAPDTAACLYTYGGTAPQFFYGGDRVERPSFQFQTRAKAKDDAAALMNLAFLELLKIHAMTLSPSGKLYVDVNPIQTPFFLRRDDKSRAYMACSFDVMKTA